MAGSSPSLDYWRRFFRSANSDIFQVIQKAIVVAATDHPEEFQQRRCSIAETLFTQRRVESEAAELRVAAEDKDDDGSERGFDDEHKANEPSISGRDEEPNRSVSKYSYHEAEALTDEIEEENQIVGEVLRIKKLLENHQEESDGVLFESLRRLQLMQISVNALQATEIGIAVGGLKRHNSKKIRHLVRTLIGEWKAMVEQWMSAAAVITENAAAAAAAVTDGTPDSVIISTGEEDEGLAFPPLDEGALLATHTTTIELSNFFDGMDEDGNLQPNVLNEKNRSQKPTQQNHVSERKPPINSVPPEVRGQTRWPQAEDKQKKPQDTRSMQTKQQLGLQRQPRPSNTDNKNGRSSNPVSERKGSSFGRTQHRQEPANVQRKPLPPPVQEKSKNAEDSSVKAKLEIAKRKLQEGYKQAENAKKQRTIQVMELHDLPKQGLHQQRQQHNNIKHRSKLREMLKGRR